MSADLIRVLVILTPKPGKLDELIAMCEDGAEHHKTHCPECVKWVCSRQTNPAEDGGEGSVVLLHEWTSMQALMDHSKLDYSVKMRDRLTEVTTTFEFKVLEAFTGFER